MFVIRDLKWEAYKAHYEHIAVQRQFQFTAEDMITTTALIRDGAHLVSASPPAGSRNFYDLWEDFFTYVEQGATYNRAETHLYMPGSKVSENLHRELTLRINSRAKKCWDVRKELNRAFLNKSQSYFHYHLPTSPLSLGQALVMLRVSTVLYNPALLDN